MLWTGLTRLLAFTSGTTFNSVAIPRVTASTEVWADPANAANGLPSGATWISFTDTGAGGQSPSNDATSPLATFNVTFTVPGHYAGILRVWADDTTGVTITPDGTVHNLATPSTTTGQWCAATAIGCIGNSATLSSAGGNIPLDLTSGTYILSFDAHQVGGDGFGVLYGADLKSVPDGGTTLMLLGGALAGLGILRRRLRA